MSVAILEPQAYLPAARAAEAAGFANISLADSICYPKESDSKYPYTAEGGREFLENKPFLEPFAAIPAMAAVTERIGFLTSVLKLPIRHPVIVAKQVSTVAVLTNDRFKFGVGTSPWPDDYEICDVPWEGRGKRFEEAIEVIKGLTAGGYFEYHGEVYDFPAIKLEPVSSKPVPILIGGHAKANIRRAAASADGWIAAGSTEEKLTEMLAYLREQLRENGREDVPFEIHAGTHNSYTPDTIKRLEELGVTDVAVSFVRRYTVEKDEHAVQELTDAIRRFGEETIHAHA